MADDQQSTSDRARRVQQFISQARQGDGGMRAWLARRAQVMQARTNEAALAKARGDQQVALRQAMQTPGALQLAEATQPGASTGGPAPVAPRPTTVPGAGSAQAVASRGFSVPPGLAPDMGPTTAVAPPIAPQVPAAEPFQPYANFGGTITGAMIPRNLGGSLPVDFGGFDSQGNPRDTTGNFMSPPPGVDRGSWISSMTMQQTRSADPTGFDAAQNARGQSMNAYQIARDAALGQMLPGSVGSNGVDYGRPQADPSAAGRAFAASGYTEQQALRDGWLTGVGTPGWQSTPPGQQLNPNGGNMAAMGPATTAQPLPAPAALPPPVSPPQATPAAPPATAAPAPAPTPAPPVNPSANLAAAIQRSTAPAAPQVAKTAVPPYRTPPAPVTPSATPAAPAAQKPSDEDVRNALTAQPRASGAGPRAFGGGSRVGLG